jgi:hypothetical protein
MKSANGMWRKKNFKKYMIDIYMGCSSNVWFELKLVITSKGFMLQNYSFAKNMSQLIP